MSRRGFFWIGLVLIAVVATSMIFAGPVNALAISINTEQEGQTPNTHASTETDYWTLLFVFVLSTFIGLGVIARVSRLLHTPLMSITNAISAIAVVGSIIVTGADYPTEIRIMGAVALFASMTNIVSGFLITDRMLKMFKQAPSRILDDQSKRGGERKEAKP
jgi:NAD(P) transhydrogenase subunit alpha